MQRTDEQPEIKLADTVNPLPVMADATALSKPSENRGTR
jgi:hypothetical protein